MWGHKHRQFYRFSEVINGCGISRTGLDNCILSGLINVHVWLYPVCVYKITEVQHGTQMLLQKEEATLEGYAAVNQNDYRRLLQNNIANVRHFTTDDGQYYLRCGSPDVTVRMDEVVILASEKEKINAYLEQQAGADHVIGMLSPAREEGTTFDPAFRQVRFQGREFTFGPIQSTIVRKLYEAAKSGNPWMSGKQLLQDAGSASFHLKNIFTRQLYWRELIISNARGLYRLHEDFPIEHTE